MFAARSFGFLFAAYGALMWAMDYADRNVKPGLNVEKSNSEVFKQIAQVVPNLAPRIHERLNEQQEQKELVARVQAIQDRARTQGEAIPTDREALALIMAEDEAKPKPVPVVAAPEPELVIVPEFDNEGLPVIPDDPVEEEVGALVSIAYMFSMLRQEPSVGPQRAKGYDQMQYIFNGRFPKTMIDHAKQKREEEKQKLEDEKKKRVELEQKRREIHRLDEERAAARAAQLQQLSQIQESASQWLSSQQRTTV